MPTFADLGFPFPLFEGDVDDASEFVGHGRCSLCGEVASACFELGIGCDVVVECPACSTQIGLDADDREAGTCRNCSKSVPFPRDTDDGLLCCFDCLRRGRAALSKDTELGMVSWEQAFEGLTHGVPGLNHPDFEMVPTDSHWVRARVDRNLLFELVRTPTYSTIQGETWRFCCKTPMTFVGAWSRETFSRQAPDGNGQAYLAAILGEDVPGLWEDQLHDVTGIYVFRCRACETVRGDWDIA
jgi:uncharacterized protein CbrC (UPF0167 family)